MTEKCRKELKTFMIDIKNHSLNTSFVMKSVIGIFGENNIILDKFLLNVYINDMSH